MQKIYLVIITLLACLLGCSSPQSGADLAPDQQNFFDIEGYFNEEIDRLEDLKPTIEKIVSLDGTSETIRPDSLNYENELSVFVNSDINKISWMDRYAADTLRNADRALQSVRYEAQDDKLRTRLIEIDYRDGRPDKINILNRTENALLEARQELSYEPNRGFSIQQRQQIRFMKPNEAGITVTFQNE